MFIQCDVSDKLWIQNKTKLSWCQKIIINRNLIGGRVRVTGSGRNLCGEGGGGVAETVEICRGVKKRRWGREERERERETEDRDWDCRATCIKLVSLLHKSVAAATSLVMLLQYQHSLARPHQQQRRHKPTGTTPNHNHIKVLWNFSFFESCKEIKSWRP